MHIHPESGEPRLAVDPRVEAPDGIAEALAHAALRARLFGDERVQPPSDRVVDLVASKERATIGRYLVLEVLGSGGMGVVIAAYDPALDRKVALKLLHTLRRENTGLRLRMEREARAMAKLSHPNVVTVHEVGEHDGDVFLVMEFIKGKDLRRWLVDRPADWRGVLEVFLQAGQGLAAAHRAGLIHRDFKPDNVFVGDDGRVRVGDFGLVRGWDALHDEAAVTQPHHESDTPGLALTLTGEILGTPAYMAPEQFSGQPADARTDQFAFCVALWEAMYGRRPFAGSSLAELIGNVTANRRALPTERGAGMGEACARPGSRAEAGRPLSHIRVHVGGAASRSDTAAPGGNECRGRRIGGRRRRRSAALQRGATGRGMRAGGGEHRFGVERRGTTAAAGRPAGDRRRVRVDHVGARGLVPFLSGRRVAGGSHGGVPERQRAGDMGRAEARTVGVVPRRAANGARGVRRGFLPRANATSVEDAVTAAAKLSQVGPCLDAGQLGRLPPPPKDSMVAEAVQAMLFDAGAKQVAGNYHEGLLVAESALTRAEAFMWPPLVAAARLRRGSLLASMGRHDAAETTLKDAYFEAARVGAWQVAASASQSLIGTVGQAQARHDEGQLWSRHADASLAMLGVDAGSLMGAVTLNSLAAIHVAMGDQKRAQSLFEQSLASRRSELGARHPLVAQSLNNLAAVHYEKGEYAEARALYEQARAIWEEALGPDHPDVASSLHNIATVVHATGGYAEARALYEQALAMILEKALGPDHPDVATSLNNLANIHQATGEYEQAKARHARSLGIRERALGLTHPGLATSLMSLASVYHSTGEYAEAMALIKRALAIREKALGPDHADVAASLTGLAVIYYSTGELGEAKELHKRAIAIKEQRLGPDHPEVALSLNNLAGVHADSCEYAEAEALYNRARDIWAKYRSISWPWPQRAGSR